MKNLLKGFFAISTMALVGCSQEEQLGVMNDTNETYTGVIEVSESRTSLGGDGSVVWSDDDAISIFKKSGFHQKYQVDEGGSTVATFKYANESQEHGATLALNYAVYPYASGHSISDEPKFTLDLASLAEQNYTEGTFENGKSVMVGQSEDTNLIFYNTLSMLRVKLCSEVAGAYSINSITLTSKSKAFSGTATVDMSQAKQSAVFDDEKGGKTVTLKCTSPVMLKNECKKVSDEYVGGHDFYILVPAVTFPENDLTIKIEGVDENGNPITYEAEYPEELQLKRSGITTIHHQFDAEEWTGTIEPTVVATAEEIASALTANEQNIVVVLTSDIDCPITSLGQQTPSSGEYKLGGENTESITIDLNGKKLNITNKYWSAIGAKNDNATITIKNGTMTSTGNSADTWNAWDVRLCNCNYEIEDVTFEKAVALDNAGKTTTLKGVTIKDNHNDDTYALWITAEGQTVTLENCTIDMLDCTDGRGIKIDNQYLESTSKVTLSVSNTTFKTEEKAAIMVKSSAGADIIWGTGNDISNVAADTQNAVWVDADAKDSFESVTVTGCTKVQEQ